MKESYQIEYVLAFAEYFRNNFDYYDNNGYGNIYKKEGCSKPMTMIDILEDWYKNVNHENIHRNLHRQ